MAVINSYFDFEDYDQPIKTYIDDRFFFSLMTSITRNFLAYVKTNEAETLDDFLNYSPQGKESSFISIDRISQDIQESETIVSVRFVKDPQTDSYGRSVFSLLDALGNIGGLNEVLQVSCGLVVSIFSGRMFFYSIISSLYQIDPINKNEIDSSNVHSEISAIQNDQSQTININPQHLNKDENTQNDGSQTCLNLRNIFNLFRINNKSNNVTDEEFDKRNNVLTRTRESMK